MTSNFIKIQYEYSFRVVFSSIFTYRFVVVLFFYYCVCFFVLLTTYIFMRYILFDSELILRCCHIQQPVYTRDIRCAYVVWYSFRFIEIEQSSMNVLLKHSQLYVRQSPTVKLNGQLTIFDLAKYRISRFFSFLISDTDIVIISFKYY